jgi:hypothetical protein
MKRILLAIIGLAFIAAGVGYYLYTKPLADLANVKPDFTLSAVALYEAFEADEAAAQTRYLGKVIEVIGRVAQVERFAEGTANVSLDGGGLLGGVLCRFQKDHLAADQIQEGQSITIKGQCTGKLMDVELTRCVIVNQ